MFMRSISDCSLSFVFTNEIPMSFNECICQKNLINNLFEAMRFWKLDILHPNYS